jgi:hypothetical protein
MRRRLGKSLALGAALALLAFVGGSVATAPAAQAASRRRAPDEFAASVSRVLLRADGSVRVRLAVLCPRNAPGDFTVLRATLLQAEGSARAEETLSPLRCTGRRRAATVVLRPSSGSTFRPGSADLSVRISDHCPRVPVGEEQPCGGNINDAYPVTLRGGRGVRPLPRLEISRVALRRDGQIQLTVAATCRVNRTDAFSILEASADQTSSGPIRQLRPAPCTGHRTVITLTLASGQGNGFDPGPAHLFVQLLSDCRVVPDDENGSFDVCGSTASIEQRLVLTRCPSARGRTGSAGSEPSRLSSGRSR